MLTTHYIEEAEKLCGRVGILNKGKLIAVGSPPELVEGVGGYVVETLDNGRRHYACSPPKACQFGSSQS